MLDHVSFLDILVSQKGRWCDNIKDIPLCSFIGNGWYFIVFTLPLIFADSWNSTRPHLMHGLTWRRHLHYHLAWNCTMNFRNLVSILSSWLAEVNHSVMLLKKISCLLATIHGKHSYWGICYSSCVKWVSYSLYLSLHKKPSYLDQTSF